jgi:hypothetical protein
MIPFGSRLAVPLTFSALLLGRVPAATTAPTFECRWTETAPVIDGRADEPAWQNAKVIERFAVPWLPGAPLAKEQTRVRLLWDREWLYFAAEMEDADVTAVVREHDGQLWENDVFELFFRPSRKHAGYFEFEVNPFGAVLDAFFPNADTWRDPQHLKKDRFHLEQKIVIRGTLNISGDRDEGWSIEGRIPWTDFFAAGGRPAPDETWRVNLTRVNGTGEGVERSTIRPAQHLRFPPHRGVCMAPLRRAETDRTHAMDKPPAHRFARAAGKVHDAARVASAYRWRFGDSDSRARWRVALVRRAGARLG